MYPTKEGSRFDCPLFPASGRRREDHYDVLAEGSWPHHVLLSHAGRLPVGVDHSPRIRGRPLAHSRARGNLEAATQAWAARRGSPMTLIRGAHAGKPAAPLRRMPRADSARHRPCERRQPPALATGCLSCVRACESWIEEARL